MTLSGYYGDPRTIVIGQAQCYSEVSLAIAFFFEAGEVVHRGLLLDPVAHFPLSPDARCSGLCLCGVGFGEPSPSDFYNPLSKLPARSTR